MSTIETSSPASHPGSFMNLDSNIRSTVRVQIGRTVNGSRVVDSAIHAAISDLLDAIRAELGAIVIDKTDLPEVTTTDTGSGALWVANYRYESGTDHKAAALRHLAALAYLEANPPVDPKVKALERLMTAANEPDGYADFRDFATRLIATGQIDIKEPS